MRYWAYVNNEILGPFEKEKLIELPNFGLASLICPEPPPGQQAEGWKEASTHPEVAAVIARPAAAPAKFQPPAAESPLAMTIRGSLIEEPAAEPPAAGPAQPPKFVMDPVPAPVKPKSKFDESSLMLTMRGSLIDPAAAALEPAADVRSGVSDPPKGTPKPLSEKDPPLKSPVAPVPSAFGVSGAQGGIPDGAQPMPGNALTREELSSQLEPLKQKLERLSATLVSIGDGQSQLLGKLRLMEGAIADMKAAAAKTGPSAQETAKAEEPKK